VFNLIPDAETQNLVSLIKGWFFVIATTLLLYHLIRQALNEATTVEQKLIESEIKFRSVFENSVDAIGVSKQGIHVLVNPAYITLFGYSHFDELIGKPILNLIAPSERPKIQTMVNRRANGESVPSAYETIGLKRDNSEFHMDVHVSNYQLHGDSCTLVILRNIDEMKRAQEALLNQEKYYRALFDLSPSGIIVEDASGSIIEVNDAYCNITGYTHDELIGKNISMVVHEDHLSKIKSNLMELLSGKFLTHDVINVHKDGSLRYLELRETAVKLLNGNKGILSVSNDITGKKLSEKKLNKAKKLIQDFIDNSPSVIYLADADGKIILVNKQFEIVTDSVKEKILGKERDSFLPKDIAEMHRANDIEVINSKKAISFEEENIERDGKHSYISLKFPLIDDEGKVYAVGGVSTDITERKLAEEHLRESEEKFRVLTESMSAAIFIFKGERFRYLNSFAETLTGYPQKELINKKFWEIVHPDYRNLIKERGLARQRGEPVASRYEFKIVTKTGEERWVDFTAGLIHFEGGPSGIGTAIDITEQKRAEEQLITFTEQMRALATHLQNIREEERASIAREMHDELGQLLTSLKMNIAFTKRELEESKPNESKKIILDEFQSMNLTIDRAVAGVRKLITQLRPELLDKLGLIAALEWYSEEFQKGTKINCEFRSEFEEISLSSESELAIFRIVQEATTNAAKHSAAKSVKIILQKLNDKLSIEIIDDGKGISENEIKGEKSFGLLGMRERAALIRGNLDVFGKPGKGTTVRLVVGN
jgi:PAS domain S-box-containing protein